MKRQLLLTVPRAVKLNQRLLSSQRRQCEEIKISGPWGTVAGKWWGPQDRRPILAIHGWQDNCGTYDTLIPHLPETMSFLAIDMPGHGHSSRIPPGMFYHGIDIATFIRRIVRYFGWEKVSLMGHSLGAMSSFIYTLIYPKQVDLLICLDALYPILHEKYKKLDSKGITIDRFIKYDDLNNSNTEPPSYTFPHLEHLLHKGSRNSIALDKCKYILNRNIATSKANPERYYFTRDTRLKVPNLMQFHEHDILENLQRVVCPLFLAMGRKSTMLGLEGRYLRALDTIKEQNKSVEYHQVDGTHHFHLNTPENISLLISKFIKKYDVDRSTGGLNELKLTC